MSETWIYLLIILGVFLCIGLGIYILRQYQALEAAKQARQQRLAEVEQKAQENRDHLIESVHVIAGAMINDERMTLTEGTIRLSVLLDSLAPQMKLEPDISVLTTVYEKTKHIPYLQAWQSLDKQEKWQYLQEMKKVEAEHEAALLKAAAILKDYPFHQHFH